MARVLAVFLSPDGGAKRTFCRGPFVASVLLSFFTRREGLLFFFARSNFGPVTQLVEPKLSPLRACRRSVFLKNILPPTLGGVGVLSLFYESRPYENSINDVLHGWRCVCVHLCLCVRYFSLHVAHSAGSIRVLPLRCSRCAETEQIRLSR